MKSDTSLSKSQQNSEMKPFGWSTIMGAALIISLLVVLFFIPGIHGGILLLDDLHVINNLTLAEGLNWWEGFQYYLFQHGGYLRRPLSYLSFYLQKDSVGHGTYHFKIAGLSLHVLNAVLVFFFFIQLLNAKNIIASGNRVWIVFACVVMSLIWALSTIQVSSVLYVTQRMAILAATFSLLALLGFTYFRTCNSPKKQLVGMLFVVCPFIVLGFLSKENAFLVFLFILLLDGTLYQKHKPNQSYIWWRRLCVITPVVILVGYFAIDYERQFIYLFRHREFNVYERFLTEHLILIEYIGKFFFPFLYNFGAINTQFPISTGLFSPLATFFSVCLIWGAIISLLVIRKKQPLIAFGLLFFFAGHVLESSVIPLELYFEHRNYLPSLGLAFLFFPVCFLLFKKLDEEPSYKTKLFAQVFFLCVMSAYVFSLLVKAQSEIKLWSNPVKQAYFWYIQNPTTQRAHSHFGSTLYNFGLYQEAALFYQQTHNAFPDDPTKELLWLDVACFDQEIKQPDLGNLIKKIGQSARYREATVIIDSILNLKESGQCSYLSSNYLVDVVDAFLANSRYKIDFASLYVVKARLYRYEGFQAKEIDSLESALTEGYRVDIALSLMQAYVISGQSQKAKLTLLNLKKRCQTKPALCRSRVKDIETIDNIIKRIQ